MAGVPEITVRAARRLALLGQGLAGSRPAGVMDVIGDLGAIQRDPTAAVAPTEELVLWSRLGGYDRSELGRLLYDERALVDYWVHIVATADLPVHFGSMRRYPRGSSARARYVREWLRSNSRFRRYVVREIAQRGPLRSRDLEDRAEVPWQTGGWNDGRSLGRMLDALWFGGKLAIVGRHGRERLWDLAARHPAYQQPRVSGPEAATRLAEQQLHALGIARPEQLGRAFDGAALGARSAVCRLIASGTAREVVIRGDGTRWIASQAVLDRDFMARSTLLSPFDNLISDRRRAERLFDFRFALELYRPAGRRRHGYFVMPLLHGDRLIARVDIRRDRHTGAVQLGAIHPEPDVASALAEAHCRKAADELTSWLLTGSRIRPV